MCGVRGKAPTKIMSMTKAEKLLQAVVKSAKSFKTGEDKYRGLSTKLSEVLWNAYKGMAKDATKVDDTVIKTLESTLVDEGGLEAQSAKNALSKALRKNGINRRETKQDKENTKAAKQGVQAKTVGNKSKGATAKQKLEQLAVSLCNGDKVAAQKLAHSVYESLKKQVANAKTLANGKKATGTDNIVSVPKGESILEKEAA